MDRVRHFLLYWAIPLLGIAMARSAVASPFFVPTGSMVPTIAVGDRVLVQKYAYGLNIPWLQFQGTAGIGTLTTREVVRWAEPERGDVILFRTPEDVSIDYVKRVIGVPGDTVEVRDDRVILNGEPVEKVYEGRDVFVDGSCREWPARRYQSEIGGRNHQMFSGGLRMDHGPVTVPADALFVLGDNRGHSADSRSWGFVPRANVRGRAQGAFMGGNCKDQSWSGWHSFVGDSESDPN